MYNHLRKNAFADSRQYSDKTYQHLCQMFNTIEPLESELGQDICEFDLSNLQKAFSLVSGTVQKSASVAFSHLRNYIQWCQSNGFHVSDAIQHLRIDELEKFRTRMVSSPKHLSLILDEVFPEPEQNQINYIYRSFLWLAFIGYEDKDAAELTAQEIDFVSMKVIPQQEGVPVRDLYAECVADLRMACSLTEFDESRGEGHKKAIRQRVDGHLLLRGKARANEPEDSKKLTSTLRPAVSRAFKAAAFKYESAKQPIPKHLSLSLSYDRIYQSGIFFRAREKESIGIEVHMSKYDRENYLRWKTVFA